MWLIAIKRWQWLALSLLVGAMLATAWNFTGDPDVNAFGPSFNSQTQFEQLASGGPSERRFTDLFVYPVRIDGATRYHAVVGRRMQPPANGAPPTWRTETFIATAPYRPAAAAGPAAADATVMAYLRSAGVPYRYAWWYEPQWATAALVAGSVVVIGLIWPTLINLVVFRSLRRPRRLDEPPAGLWDVKAATAPGTETPDATEAGVVDQLVAELSARVSSDAVPQSAAETAVPDPPAAAGLTVEPLVPIAAPGAEAREYREKPDDFYPTVLKAPRAPDKG